MSKELVPKTVEAELLPAAQIAPIEVIAKLVASGLTHREVILQSGYPAAVIAEVMADPRFNATLASLMPTTEDVRMGFLSMAGKAQTTIRNLMEQKADPRAAFEAAKETLAQAGFGPIQRVAVAIYTPDHKKLKQLKTIVGELVK